MCILSTCFPTSEKILKIFIITFPNNNLYPALYFIISLSYLEVGGREKEIDWEMWMPEHSNAPSSQELLETKGSPSERDSHDVTEVANRKFSLEIGKTS
jgi:hypothetical protein